MWEFHLDDSDLSFALKIKYICRILLLLLQKIENQLKQNI